MREIYKRDIFVEALNPDGYFFTQQKLDEMKELGYDPYIKILFDGMGHYD